MYSQRILNKRLPWTYPCFQPTISFYIFCDHKEDVTRNGRSILDVRLFLSTNQDSATFLPYGGDVKVDDAFKVIGEYKTKIEAIRATQVRLIFWLPLSK